MNAADLIMKVGDTLLADCVYRDSDNNPVNLNTAGITIQSAVSFADGIHGAKLEVTVHDQIDRPGEFTIRGSSDNWPADQRVRWDIRYFRGSDSFSSRTITIQMLEPIT